MTDTRHINDILASTTTENILGLAKPATTIAIIGNSIAAQDTPTTSNSIQLPNGCFGWANYLLGQRFDVPATTSNLTAGYLGVGGERTDQILARISSVIALDVDYCLLLGIIENDVNDGYSTATTQANITSMLNLLQNAGITPIIVTGLPSLLTDTAAKANAYYANNQFIRNLRYTRSGVIVVDDSHRYIDFAQTYPQPLSSYVVSGPHPNPKGAYNVGYDIYLALKDIIPERQIFTNHWLSAANGGTTPDVLVNNPLMQGTAGTAGTGLGGADPVADGWTGQAMGGGSGVGSKVTRTDLPLLEWQQIAFTGDAAYTFGSDYARVFSTTVNLPNGGVDAGSLIQGFCEVEADGSDTNLLGFDLAVRCLSGTPEYYRGMMWTSTNVFPLGVDYPAGVIATPKFVVPSGTTSLQIHVRAHASAASALFTARFGRSQILDFS